MCKSTYQQENVLEWFIMFNTHCLLSDDYIVGTDASDEYSAN